MTRSYPIGPDNLHRTDRAVADVQEEMDRYAKQLRTALENIESRVGDTCIIQVDGETEHDCRNGRIEGVVHVKLGIRLDAGRNHVMDPLIELQGWCDRLHGELAAECRRS